MKNKIIYYLTCGLCFTTFHFYELPAPFCFTFFSFTFFFFCNYMLHIKPHFTAKKLFLVQSTASLFSFQDINLANRLTENILDHDKH